MLVSYQSIWTHKIRTLRPMTSTVVQDRHVLHGQLELALTPSKTPAKIQRQEHPGLLLGVLDAADRQASSW